MGRDINSPDASCATTSTAAPTRRATQDTGSDHIAGQPGRIAPAFKARVFPPDQSGRGKGHRLPCRVGASTRLPLRSTQILSGSPVLTARSKVKLPVCSVPLTCHRAFTLVAVLSSTPRRLCCRDHSLLETRGSTSGDGCVGCGVVVGDPESIG